MREERVLRFLASALLLPAWIGCREREPAPPAVRALGAPRPAARADAAGIDLRPAERDAVAAFLRRNPDLRPAVDEDRRPPIEQEDIRELYGVYHPYFVRGDPNGDALLDFVMGFVRRDSEADSPWFSVVVFSGKEDSGFAPGVVLEKDVSLADGDLSVDRDTVVVTPDLAQEETRRYRWDSARRSYLFVPDGLEEATSVPLART
jgi:hypothetical protein